MKTPVEQVQWLTRRTVVIAIASYAIVMIAYGSAVLVWATTLERGALFGDMFGAFNAAVSGFAMLGVVAAIFLQREELALQRQELADTRAELQRQREALDSQTESLRDQVRLGQTQLARAGKDYIERNKPVVFCDRVEDLARPGHADYLVRNVGGGFAVNVYVVPDEGDRKGGEAERQPIPLGSVGPGKDRLLPRKVNEELQGASTGMGFLVIAEGPVSRTTQWTVTLNYRTPDADLRGGEVEHQLSHLRPHREATPLFIFMDTNRSELLRQLRSIVPGGSRADRQPLVALTRIPLQTPIDISDLALREAVRLLDGRCDELRVTAEDEAMAEQYMAGIMPSCRVVVDPMLLPGEWILRGPHAEVHPDPE